MNVKHFILATNPFFEAYIHSDFLGKLIFIALLALSICSWIVLIYKVWITIKARRLSAQFQKNFSKNRHTPLNLPHEPPSNPNVPNPFLSLYHVLKKHTVDILNKNRHFGEGSASYLSPSDVNFIESHLMTTVSSQTKFLEKNLFILATVVSLAPFLGLLGTVWGILTTFSEPPMQGAGGTSQIVLGGLSLALTTTVIGLLDAIPALIGYNYLRNGIREFETDMEGFATEILASVEMQYRKVDLQ